MKLYVLKVTTFWRVTLLLVLTIILSAAFYSSDKSLAVFEPKRELPIYSVDCLEKKIAITFDCAWGSEDIPQILSILKDHDVKVTFFVVGLWAQKNKDAVKMISNEGHDVANHSYSHLRMGCIDNNKIKSEIIKCNNTLKEITGKENNLFRAPYGEYNDNVVKIARELNQYTIQWDVDSLDWKPGITPQQIQKRILSNVKNGSILLFHNDTAHTVRILPDIITALKNEGYSFEPASSLIMRENFYIDFSGKQKRNQ